MGGDHTAGVLARFVTAASLADRHEGVPPVPVEPVDFTLGNVGGALLLACLAAIPLGISMWALLDAARRPRWAWALADRRQVVWMAAIMFGMLSLVGGLLISGWYLGKVRPVIAAAEAGDF